jgi:hypothetical protein
MLFPSRNALTRLAIRLLSVVANLAGCERSFSIFGNIHTKTRNKLGTETVHKTGVLKMDIRRRHVKEGRVPTRKKRQFSTLDQPTSVTTPVSVDPEANPIDYVQSLINEAEQDDDDDNLPNVEELLESIQLSFPVCAPAPTPSTSTNPPRRQARRKIPLSDLFLYPSTTEEELEGGLAFYWKGGVKNLEAELARYDATQLAEQAMGGEGANMEPSLDMVDV